MSAVYSDSQNDQSCQYQEGSAGKAKRVCDQEIADCTACKVDKWEAFIKPFRSVAFDVAPVYLAEQESVLAAVLATMI